MTSATTSVKVVHVPRWGKNIQEVNEHVYAVLRTHWNTLYPYCLKITQDVNQCVYTVPGTHWNTWYPDCVRNIHAVNGRGYRRLVKCGIAACGMRKVKCGMECVENYCGTVGNMRNAESCPVGGRMRFHTGCKVQGYIGLATFVCSSDLSCKISTLKLLNFVTGSSIFQRNCRKRIMKNLMKFMKLSKLKIRNL